MKIFRSSPTTSLSNYPPGFFKLWRHYLAEIPHIFNHPRTVSTRDPIHENLDLLKSLILIINRIYIALFQCWWTTLSAKFRCPPPWTLIKVQDFNQLHTPLCRNISLQRFSRNSKNVFPNTNTDDSAFLVHVMNALMLTT